MTDTVSASVRSRNMSAIKATNTKPELAVRRALHGRGFRFRVHRRDLPGNPDIVLPKYRAVVWVNGCFWHGHQCTAGRLPRSREDYWSPKIERTKARDARAIAEMDTVGWRSMVVWECCLERKGAPGLQATVDAIAHWIVNGTASAVLDRKALGAS